MNHKFVTKTLAAAIFAGLALSSVASHAATISTLFNPGLNTIQDQDAERFIASDGITVKTSGALVVGDIFEAILRFDSVNAGTIGDTLPAPYQLSGYNQMRIDNIIDLPDFIVGQDLVRLVFGYNVGGIGGINILPIGAVVEIY